MRTLAPPPLPLSQTAPALPVTMCSEATEYLQRNTRAPKTPTNLLSSQRMIIPIIGSPLPPLVYELQGRDDLWTSLGIPDTLRPGNERLSLGCAALAESAQGP